MSPDQRAAQLLHEAIKSFKDKTRDKVMALPPLPEHDAARRELVSQFVIADDVSKTIAAQIR